MKRPWTWLVAAVVMGLCVAAVAQDNAQAARRKRKPAEVNLVQSVPLEVVATGAPLPVAVSGTGTPLPVDVAALPAVDVASLPPLNIASMPSVTVSAMPSVQVSSLPSVVVSSMPSVTVANSTLDVRVTNSSITTGPATNSVVTPTDLNGVTISSNFTSTHVIDCAGYSAVSVFVSHDTYSSGSANFAVEFMCGGVAAWVGGDSGSFGVPPGSTRSAVTTSSVLGPELRIRAFTNTTLTNVKVVVYLRR